MSEAPAVPMPKTATKFAEDAKAAGFTVTIDQSPGHLAVTAERPRFNHTGTVSGTATWSNQTVYDEPLSAERVGFRTRGGRTVFRFDYGTAQDHSGAYHSCTSVRQVRGYIGLTI